MFLLMIYLVIRKRTQIQIWMKMRHFGVDRVSKLRFKSRLAITTQGSNYITISWGAYLVCFRLVIGFILVEDGCSVDISCMGSHVLMGWLWHTQIESGNALSAQGIWMYYQNAGCPSLVVQLKYCPQTRQNRDKIKDGPELVIMKT